LILIIRFSLYSFMRAIHFFDELLLLHSSTHSLTLKWLCRPYKAICACDQFILNATTQLNAKLFTESARDLIDYSLIYCDCCTPSVSRICISCAAADFNKLFPTLIYLFYCKCSAAQKRSRHLHLACMDAA